MTNRQYNPMSRVPLVYPRVRSCQLLTREMVEPCFLASNAHRVDRSTLFLHEYSITIKIESTHNGQHASHTCR